MKREVRHLPVLLDDVLRVIDPQPGQTIVDCTLGLGGHSSELLKRISPGGKLIAIDFDAANITIARAKLAAIGANAFELFHNNFAALPNVLREAGIERVDGILADLGVASPQIDDPARGFSYRADGPLDMRMNVDRGEPASKLLARLSEREIREALLELGDEDDAPQIARLIVERRAIEAIITTQQLTEIVCEARDFTLKRAAGAKLHPAARTFQALRILVNREMANLDRLLAVLPDCLKEEGVAAIISFHSGEDRRVKDAFREGLRGGIYSDISREPIIATEDEQRANPRSRSAKPLRAQKQGSMTKPNYGLDAPGAVRNLSIFGVLGVIAIVTRVLHVWDKHSLVALIGKPLMVGGTTCGLMALWMAYDSYFGKVRERETQLDMLNPWRGDEQVLDVGCGRGLFLIGAAKRLDASRGGRATGVDLWQAEDLSGNTPEAALENARLENVADRVDVKTGDARRLPFEDRAFDVIVSSMALHNIYNAGERVQAIREIARVLKPGGRVLIVDIRHCTQYAAALRNAGLADARYHKGFWSYPFLLLSFGALRLGVVKASMSKSQ